MTEVDIAAVQETPADQNNAPQEQETTQDVETQTEPVDPPWPEKAEKAHAKQKAKAIRLSYENKLLKQQLAEIQKAQQAQAPQSAEPNEASFDNYGDYLKAVARYEAKQELNEGKQSREQLFAEAQKAKWIDERVSVVQEKVAEAKAALPDFDKVAQENAEIIGQFSGELEEVILSLDNPALALYNLAKDDLLQDLAEMPLPQAAVLLGKALAKGIPQKKTVTSAPAPMRGVKGSGSPTTSLASKNPDELMAWLKT
jgi:hypothetical protein